MTRPEHLRANKSDRGFAHLPAIPSQYGGSVRVYESSAATAPHIWLTAEAPVNLREPDGPTVKAPIHLTVDDARRLAEQLLLLVGADDHLRLMHPDEYGTGPERWPDGSVVLEERG